MKRLKSIKRLIISVGHGGDADNFDTGAVFGNVTENAQCRVIAGYLVKELLAHDMPLLVVPDWSLSRTTKFINTEGGSFSDWAIELHKDSTDAYDAKKHHRLCGFYFVKDSVDSEVISKAVVNTMIGVGAHVKSWTRADTISNHGRLGFLRDTNCLSHIAELGFVEGDTSDAECQFYAKALARSIIKVLNTVKGV
jgi:hypothetical protein